MLPTRPPIHPEVLADFKNRGREVVRASLMHVATTDRFGEPVEPHIQTLYALRRTASGTVSVTRADGEQWLAYLANRQAAWVKVGTIAAIAAAVLALCAWIFPMGQ